MAFPGYPARITDHGSTPLWQTTPPTEPGMFRVYSQAELMAYWLEIWRGIDGKLYVSVDYIADDTPAENGECPLNYYLKLNSISHWLGPLPVPEPPK